MENATKAIIIAASVIITMMIVGFGFLIMNKGGVFIKEEVIKLDNIKNNIQEEEYLVYDNKEAQGSEVVGIMYRIKTSGDYVGVHVITKGGDNWYCNDASDLNNLEEAPDYVEDIKNSETYINPLGKFMGSVTRADSGRIAAITFTQQ